MPDGVRAAAAHPYIPNSVPQVKAEMLRGDRRERPSRSCTARSRSGCACAAPLDLPPALRSELELRRHVEGLLARNRSCAEALSFLGGGCWQHYVPAVCDEIVEPRRVRHRVLRRDLHRPRQAAGALRVRKPDRRAGRARGGQPADLRLGHGRRHGDLHGRPHHRARRGRSCRRRSSPERLLDRAGLLRAMGRTSSSFPSSRRPACSTSTRCAARSPTTSPVSTSRTRRTSGRSRRDVARDRRSSRTTAARSCVVGVDPISLGVLEAPPRYGADIVCGDIQPLGVHMHYGGGLGGFVATPDEERYVGEYPTFLIGLSPTSVEGEYGFGEVTWERTSYVQRGESSEYAGTTQYLWAIGAAVYLSLLGPRGLAELGQGIMQRARYAAQRLGRVPGVRAPLLDAPDFKEFVVGFDATGKTVAEINRRLARARHLRRPRPLARFPGARPERALLRHRGAHEGRHRPARRRARGGDRMTLRPFHQASWNEPIVHRARERRASAGCRPGARSRRSRRSRRRRSRTSRTRCGATQPARLPGAQPAAGAAPLPAPLAGDARARTSTSTSASAPAR